MFGDIIRSVDLLLKYKKAKSEGHDYRAEYIEKIADDAEEIAAIWTEILAKLQIDESFDTSTDNRVRELTRVVGGGGIGANMPPYSRLSEFQNRLHFALEEGDKKHSDLLVEKIANLLHTRNITRQSVLEEFGTDDWKDEWAERFIQQINQQAAELRVFALEYKVRR